MMALIRSFWYKGPLSPYEKLCLSSFVAHGHRFILHCYDRIDVPPGVELVDAATIFPESEVYFYTDGASAGSPSAFSNLFRYELLRRHGEWWSDTDVICLREDLPAADLAFAYEDDVRINGAVLKMPANHSLARQLVAEARALGTKVRWGQPGPYLITRLVKLNQLENFLLPTRLIYPIHWSRALDLVDPKLGDEISEKVTDSIFVHLWNEIFRRAPILKEVAPPRGSFLHRLFCQYGVEVRSGLIYSDYEIGRILDSVTERRQAEVKRDAATAERDTAIAERNAARTERDAALAARDAAVAERNSLRSERGTSTAMLRLPRKWLAHIAGS
jgi:hypothetical protein